MSFDRDADRLEYILELIDLIKSEIKGYSRAAFLARRNVRDLAAYRLGTIGETARHLSEELKNLQAGVPWRAIYTFRNIFAHDYPSINSEYVWNIIERDLDDFEQSCRLLFSQLDTE